MTVWVVTLNGHPVAICGSKDRAGDAIESEKRRLGANAGTWRPIGGDAWSSPQVTSLRRQPFQVQS